MRLSYQITVAVVVIFTLVFLVNTYFPEKEITIKPLPVSTSIPFELFWACMEGCNDMEKLILNQEVKDYNDTLSQLYNRACSDNCCIKYFDKVDCLEEI